MQRVVSTAAVAMALMHAGAVLAQDGTSRGDSADASNDIIVTALRRDSGLQETPISISALGEDALQKMNVTSAQDLFRSLPNTNVSSLSSGRTRLSVRGIQAAGEPTVGVYYDEASIAGPSGASQDGGGYAPDLNLFDVERIELLRGPQGTLYGASSMSGALRVIFRKPVADRFEAASEASYSKAEGGTDGLALRAMVNVPILENRLALRISGARQITPGYLDSTTFDRANTGETKATSVRAMLGWTPTDDISVVGTFVYQKRKSNNQQGWFERLGSYRTDSEVYLPFDSDLKMYNLTANWDIGPVRLTATGTHYEWEIVRNINLTRTVNTQSQSASACRTYFGLSSACSSAQLAQFRQIGLASMPAITYQPLRIKVDSGEVRASSNGSGPLQWTVGLFYQRSRDRTDSHFTLASAQTGQVYDPLRDLASRYIANTLEQKAGFANVSYQPLPGLTLLAGARRYSYDKKIEGEVLLTNPLVAVSAAPYSQVSADAKGWLTNFNASYQVTSDIMVYASAGQGFRPGGANNVPGLPQTLVTFSPDRLWSYEAGVKSSWFGDTLTLNAALFQTDWDNIQVSARAATGPFSFLTNAGAARIRGGEVEMSWRPATGFELTLGAGNSNGKLTQDQANSNIAVSGSTGQKDDRLPDAPRWTFNGGAEYGWGVGREARAFVRGEAFYRSHMNSTFRADTDPYFERYGNDMTFNARAGVEADGWDVSVYVENVTDRKALVGATSSQASTREVYSIAPRTFGVIGRKQF